MTLEAAFEDLVTHLQQLHEGLLGLRTTVVEDKPLKGDSVLVDVFGDATEELLGWLEEALVAAGEGRQAAAYPTDLERARRALTTCQERCIRIAHHFSSDLVAYERIAELTRFGRQRKGEWHAWVTSVKEALDECQQLLYDVNETLFRCWQEITELVGITSVSVQASSIGQQITTPEGREAAREATT